jgi:putative transcriptional regulator
MTKRNIGNEIITGLEEIKAWKRGEVKLRTFSVELPRAADVPHIRRSLGFSQPEFALFMGVSVATLRNWEQERREPHGPARSLLLVAAKQPAAVREAFKSAAPSPKKRAFSKANSTSRFLRFPKAA